MSLVRRFVVTASLVALALACAGCSSGSDGRPYVHPYRRVDRDSAAFREAVAREIEAEKARGKSPRTAETIAERRVTNQFVARETAARTERVAPLVAALADLDRPRGCWAHTTTTTTRRPEKTTVLVERFNPYEPEERLWTLVHTDGRPPTESEQSAYRKARLRKWRKQQEESADRLPASKRTATVALMTTVSVSQVDPGSPVVFSFEHEARHIALLGDQPRSRETYALDPSGSRVVHHAQTYLDPITVFGSLRIDASDLTTDYGVIEPSLPPFPLKTTLRYRLHHFGKDSGEVIVETAYSDYRRVTCHDERFSVRLGELNVMDFIPEGK